MFGASKQLRILSLELLSAARKRREISGFLRKRGFVSLGKGAWLGFCGNDVVSGLLIEGSPSDTYISSFVLPIFDELNFVSWSLGRRIVHCSANESTKNECKIAISEYCSYIAPIKSPVKLIEYMDRQAITGFYPTWVRYLCYVRDGYLELADAYMDDDRKVELHPSALKKLGEIAPAVEKKDMPGVAQVLGRWERISRKIFGEGAFSISDCS